MIVWDSVHSGSGRTALADNNTDYYPVPLSADTLRPGTVYADPYGRILMMSAPKTVIDRKRAGCHDKVLSAASIGFSKM